MMILGSLLNREVSMARQPRTLTHWRGPLFRHGKKETRTMRHAIDIWLRYERTCMFIDHVPRDGGTH